ncbi:MAG: helix-turn-helix domain-containing protein, partial [Bacteroidota bacterium]
LLSLLLRKGRKPLSQKLLIGLLATIVVLLGQELVFIQRWYRWVYLVMGVALNSWYVAPPLLYLLVKSLLDPGFRLQGKHWFLFSLPIVLLLFWVASMLGFRIDPSQLFASNEQYSMAWILMFLSMSLGFTAATLLDLQQLKASKQGQALAWLRHFHLGLATILLVSMILLIFFVSTRQYSGNFEYWLLVAYEVLVMILVWKMLQPTDYLKALSHREYANTLGETENWEKLHQRLDHVIKEKNLHLDTKLSLHTLSEATAISENQLSQLFSQYLQTNFYTFVNRYRLQAFEQNLRDPSLQHLKITAIAEASGFHSKASFYKVFKQVHQMTPTEFRKRL